MNALAVAPTRDNVSNDDRCPRVSIGLPVYNGELYLREAIESILSQTYGDFELIISDNASTDGTEEIARTYANSDSRIWYRRNETNIGGMNNANLTFRLSRGEYYRMAAHDDRCAPTLLERCVEVLDRHPGVSVCLTAAISIDSDGNETAIRHPTTGAAPRPHQRFRELTVHPEATELISGLMRSEILAKTKLQQSYTGSDFVLAAELALWGPFYLLDEPLFYKRYHDGNVYRDWRGRMAWIRPDLAETGKPTLPTWMMMVDYVRTVGRVPMSISERALCLAGVARLVGAHWRGLGGDVIVAAEMLAHSKEWRRARYAPERWR
jgi:glycosyltransferase involved in cell wall biosynthesis